MTPQERLVKRLYAAVVVMAYATIAISAVCYQKSVTLQHTQERASQLTDELATANKRADRNQSAALRLREIESGEISPARDLRASVGALTVEHVKASEIALPTQ